MRATGAGFCFNVGRGVSAFAPLALGALATGVGLGTGLVVCAGFFLCAAFVMTFLPSLRSAAPIPALSLETEGAT